MATVVARTALNVYVRCCLVDYNLLHGAESFMRS